MLALWKSTQRYRSETNPDQSFRLGSQLTEHAADLTISTLGQGNLVPGSLRRDFELTNLRGGRFPVHEEHSSFKLLEKRWCQRAV